ncbi:MAG TPA: nitroreductase family protein, partial [Thermoleophilia bacterium]|nr:nitroreductase family protein [Thermoleophilia bacterium]
GGMMDAIEAILARRSIRRFTAEDVSVEDERTLIEAAFAGPSSGNGRPWHFVVVRDAETRRRLAGVHQWSGLLARAPLVIAVLGRADADAWVEDGAAATENVLIAATALDLGSCWVGVWENAPEPQPAEVTVLEILGTTPEKYRCLCLIAVGHPADHKPPRTQFQPTKLSYERVGRHTR